MYMERKGSRDQGHYGCIRRGKGLGTSDIMDVYGEERD